ncbi:MAG: ABC transporter permease [Pyrinomonadaceae bacterium MAG19_C2-C3]|nr:ABC transporter permease [Pyrinomonadaceae bacterium MAG19_C2-C3]
MKTLMQDVRYAVRMLLRNKRFAVAAVISLALGIGANTTIFSVVNALLLKSLPYNDPERIVLVWGDTPSQGIDRNQVSATDVADWRNQNSVFEEIATYSNWGATFSGVGEEPERVPAMQVGDGYFKVMKAEPLLGRVFLPEEQEDGKDFVIVLSHGLWQRRFGGDANIIGGKVSLSGRPYTVVGVMPADFRSLPSSLIEQQAEFYRPVAEKYDNEERDARHLRAIARLKPGATIRQAQAEMSTIASRIEQEHPTSNKGYGVNLASLSEDTVGGLRPTLLTLFGVVVFVLLIACANVGNLLLTRTAARKKEIAIRAALGAGRVRLMRQLLTESVLLALIGGAAGLMLALWGTSFVESVGSQVTPLLSGIKIDSRVLGFTIAISVVTGIFFGLAPALRISKPELSESLKEGGRSSGANSSRNRLRDVLVVSEIAMALVLLVCAGLLIKSVMRLRDVEPGFNSENRLTMSLTLPQAKYPKPHDWTAFYNNLTERVETLPGVQAAGVTSVLPLSSNFDGRGLAVEDYPKPRGEEISVDLYITTPNYLRAMSIPTLKGRALSGLDTETSPPVALINETMAKELWANEDPLGKRIKFPGSESSPQPWRTIVGVVSDVSQYGLDKKASKQIYLPESQYPTSAMSFVVHTSSDPKGLIAAVRNEVYAIDKDQAVYNIATMEQLMSDSISLRRFFMLLLTVFAGLALVLASIGIYGVMAYTVALRTNEIGIRMALGARTSDVLNLVLKQGLFLTFVGIALGLFAAFSLTRLIQSLLYEVTAADPVIFVTTALVLASVALLACYIPARRATKVDPMIALRHE